MGPPGETGVRCRGDIRGGGGPGRRGRGGTAEACGTEPSCRVGRWGQAARTGRRPVPLEKGHGSERELGGELRHRAMVLERPPCSGFMLSSSPQLPSPSIVPRITRPGRHQGLAVPCKTPLTSVGPRPRPRGPVGPAPSQTSLLGRGFRCQGRCWAHLQSLRRNTAVPQKQPFSPL